MSGANPAAVRAVRENLDRAGLAGRATVLRRDARKALRAALGPFDLVILDPPYGVAPAALDAVVATIDAERPVAAGGLVVLTRPARGYTPVIPLDWRSDRQLSYGDAVILVYRV